MTVQNALLLILAISWSASGSHVKCNKGCHGSWRMPQNCKKNCEYVAEWCATNDEVIFEVTGKTAGDGWIGIGFSNNDKMPNSDVVVGGVMKNGTSFIEDRWASRRNRPLLDESQDIYDTAISQVGDMITMQFTRKQNTGDKNDLELNCQYFLYAWEGGINRNNMITRHKNRKVSGKEICMCDPVSTDMPNPVVTSISVNPTVVSTTVNPTVVSTTVNPTVVSTTVNPTVVFVTPIVTPTVMPTRPDDMDCPPQCSVGLDRCRNSLSCMPLLQRYRRACRNVIAYNNTGDMPICSKECKEAAEELKTDRRGMFYSCCSCDDEMCRRGRRNFERFCKIDSRECKEMLGTCDMNTPRTCQSCKVHKDFCKQNTTCKALFDDTEMKCKSVFEWDKSMDKEPVCTEECKSSLIEFHQFGKREDNCCSCGKITDDRNINDLRYTINCQQKKRNTLRFCFDRMVPSPNCDHCKNQEDMNPPIKCFDVLKMCSNDKDCKRLLDDMEKKCAPVTSWNKDKGEEPKCSEDCNKAVAKLNAHKIGRYSPYCDCHMPKRDNFYSLSRDDDFEKKCINGQNNIRSFCFYNNHCKSGLKTKCDWVVSVCEKDPSCWQLYMEREQQCGEVFNWTDIMNQPVCSDKCKKAHYQLQQHDIWRWNMDCECGKFSESKEISKTERCYRQKHNYFLYCSPSIEQSCPKDPCDPNVCSVAKDVCFKSPSCQSLYEDWETTCMEVWNSTTDTCSEECKTATFQLFKDEFGENLKWCDCGAHENVFAGDKPSVEQTVLAQCFERKHKMRDVCEIEDAGLCQICRKNKVCERPCDRVMSRCHNDTNCSEIFNNYSTACQEIFRWNTSSTTTPMCSDECKEWADRLFMDPIGKSMKCCRCDTQDKRCINMRRNVGVFCGVDFNNVNECHNDPRICRPMRDSDDDRSMPGDRDTNSRNMRNGNNRDNNNDRRRDDDNDMRRDGNNDRHGNRPMRDGRDNGRERDNMMSPPNCLGWIERCRRDKCCGKAFHEANYYCKEVRYWNGTGDAPQCSKRCLEAVTILLNDPIGKNMGCCECPKFSDIDKSNRMDVERVLFCKGSQKNMDDICNVPQIANCSRPDKFQEICAVENCQDVTMMCQNNVTCSELYDVVEEKCGSFLLSDNLICSDDCRQALIRLHTDPIGYKMRCCDCGRPQRIPVGCMPTQTVPMDPMHPRNMMMSPNQCHLTKSKAIKHCGLIDNCEDCKASVCPGSCEIVTAHCVNDTKCHHILENYHRECKQVLFWEGNTMMPMCTDECKRWINEIENDPIGQFFKCCRCDERNRTKRMECALKRRNTEEICDVELDSAEVCQYHRKACNIVKNKEMSVKRRDQCPPESCDDWRKRCTNDKRCLKVLNDFRFRCHNLLEWKDGQTEPMCTSNCQQAMDKLASLTNRTMGGNFLCCTCGNYSDLYSNSLGSIRAWETCRRHELNIERFCGRHQDCADCRRRPMDRPNRPNRPSCTASFRMCDNISGCRDMRSRIKSSCSNIFSWKRGDGPRPQCTPECRRALNTMAGSRYQRTTCCDCQGDDVTTEESTQCQTWHRNFQDMCNFRPQCDARRPGRNTTTNQDDCFHHMENCNKDMQCRELFFDYTEKCAPAFSGKQMTRDQEMMCREAARMLVEYREFGENITKCECNTYPELCKEIFKNRFLFDKSCKDAEERCKNDTACNMLWNSHKSCMVTSTMCPWSCRAKAVLLYRHRLGREWWQTCRPHKFEQHCFVIY